MGIPNVNPRLLIIGNGTRGPFDLAVSGTPIRVRTASQLVVRRYSSTTDEDGTLLVLNTDYLVTNTDVDDVSITLTVAQAVLASTERLLVNRTQEIAAVIDLTRGGDFSGPTISAAMSVLSEQLQETRRNDNRSIQVDWLTTTAPTLPLPPLTEQAALVRDVDGGISQIAISDFAAGPAGDSAYEVAVNNGFVGTEAEWLETLIGTSSRDEQVFSGDAVDTTFVFTGMVITDKLNIMIFVDGIVQRESDYGLSNDGTDTTITFTSAPVAGTNNIVMRGAVLTGGGGGAAVDSVNGQTGAVVLDADDIGVSGTTNKFATAAEKTKLGHISVTQAVDLDAIETRVNALDASVVLKGTWDASGGTFPGSGAAQAGDSYIVSTGGTVDSVVFVAGDRVIAITDNASTSTFAANWFKADYTDQVLSVMGQTGAVTGLVQTTGPQNVAGVKTFTDDPIIPDEAYGVGWNGSMEPPTKNAVYDKIQTMGGGGSGDFVGPASSTLKGIVGFGDTSGKLGVELTAAEIRTAAGLATSDSPQFAGVNVGAATDTTITRVSAGVIAVEGIEITTNTQTQTLLNKTFTNPTVNGAALSGTLSGAHTLSGLVTFSAGADMTPAATPSTTAAGYLGAPQRSISAADTFVMSDAGKHLYHPAADTTARAWTIPANASVAYPIGTVIAIVNEAAAGVITLSITSDTLRWGSSTGSRTLAANSTATLLKVTSTQWRLTGDGIT